MKPRRIKHNDLLPWFLEDHGTLPKAYLDSCRKFFEEISNKPQACHNRLVDYRQNRKEKYECIKKEK